MFAKPKYLVIILLSITLLLVGCDGTALSVKEAMIHSLDQQSAEFEGTFSMELNLPENLNKQDEGIEQVLSFLKNGAYVYGKQIDLQKSQLHFVPLGQQQPIGYKMIVDNGTVYATSEVDEHYVKFENIMNLYQDDIMQQQIDPEKITQYQLEATELIKDFYRNYLQDFGYNLKNATDHGTETLNLPNGNTVQAQHIQIMLDEEELYQLLVYALENLVTNENVKQFISDYIELAFTLMPENQQATPEEMKMIKEMTVQYSFMALEQLKNELNTLTADEALNELGILDFVAIIDYYINEKQIMKNDILFNISWGEFSQPASIKLASQFFYWNHNKELTLDLPSDSQVITYASLQENRGLVNEFNKESWLYDFLEGTLKEMVSLTFDVDDGITTYNQTQITGVSGYISNSSTMVPFRFLGESMGADISWIADSRTAVYQLNGTEIRMQVGSKTAWVNGAPVIMNTAPEIKNNRLYITVRFVSENLDAQVQWLPESKQAVITFMK